MLRAMALKLAAFKRFVRLSATGFQCRARFCYLKRTGIRQLSQHAACARSGEASAATDSELGSFDPSGRLRRQFGLKP